MGGAVACSSDKGCINSGTGWIWWQLCYKDAHKAEVFKEVMSSQYCRDVRDVGVADEEGGAQRS